jgi:hypothetical protein
VLRVSARSRSAAVHSITIALALAFLVAIRLHASSEHNSGVPSFTSPPLSHFYGLLQKCPMTVLIGGFCFRVRPLLSCTSHIPDLPFNVNGGSCLPTSVSLRLLLVCGFTQSRYTSAFWLSLHAAILNDLTWHCLDSAPRYSGNCTNIFRIYWNSFYIKVKYFSSCVLG